MIHVGLYGRIKVMYYVGCYTYVFLLILEHNDIWYFECYLWLILYISWITMFYCKPMILDYIKGFLFEWGS